DHAGGAVGGVDGVLAADERVEPYRGVQASETTRVEDPHPAALAEHDAPEPALQSDGPLAQLHRASDDLQPGGGGEHGAGGVADGARQPHRLPLAGAADDEEHVLQGGPHPHAVGLAQLRRQLGGGDAPPVPKPSTPEVGADGAGLAVHGPPGAPEGDLPPGGDTGAAPDPVALAVDGLGVAGATPQPE